MQLLIYQNKILPWGIDTKWICIPVAQKQMFWEKSIYVHNDLVPDPIS